MSPEDGSRVYPEVMGWRSPGGSRCCPTRGKYEAVRRILSRDVDIGAWEEVKPLTGRYVDEEPDAEG